MQVNKDKIILQTSDSVDTPTSGKSALHIDSNGLLVSTDENGIVHSYIEAGSGGAGASQLAYTPTVSAYYPLGTPDNVQDALDSTARESYFSKHIALQQASTSINQGGTISVSGSDSIVVEGGYGFWIDHTQGSFNPTFTKVTWATQVVQIPNISNGEEFSFVYVEDPLKTGIGTVDFKQDEPTPEDYRNKFLLGKVIHRDGTADFVVPLRPAGNDVFNQYTDLAHAIGTINIDGNVWGPADADNNLTLLKSEGTSFRLNSQTGNLDNPHTTSDLEFNSNQGDVFSYVYPDGAGGVTYVNGISAVDPLHYYNPDNKQLEEVDDAGGFFNPPNYSIQRIYSFPKPSTGGGGKHYIFYGQDQYTTLDNALEGIQTENFDLPATNFYDASLRGWLIVRRDITDFSNPSHFQFISAGKFGENAGGSSLSAQTRSLFRDDQFKIENNGDPTSFLRVSLQNLLDTGETITINANSSQNGDIDLTLPAISGQLMVQSEMDSRYVNVTGDTMTGDLTLSNLASISGSDNSLVTVDSNGTLQKTGTTVETISGGDIINIDSHLVNINSSVSIGDLWIEEVGGITSLKYKNSSGIIKSVELD
jgi:hypothetical protein